MYLPLEQPLAVSSWIPSRFSNSHCSGQGLRYELFPFESRRILYARDATPFGVSITKAAKMKGRLGKNEKQHCKGRRGSSEMFRT